MTKQKYSLICTHCGSDNVKWDAWATWNPETQQMELESTFESAYCNQCEGECNTKEIPYKDNGKTPTLNEAIMLLEELNNDRLADQESGFEEGIYDKPTTSSIDHVSKFIDKCRAGLPKS